MLKDGVITDIDITDIELTTERLILRPWRESDLADFYEYASVDGVGQMAGWNPHRNMEESQAILNRFIEGRHVFALEHKGKVIGSLGVEKYNEEDHLQRSKDHHSERWPSEHHHLQKSS